MVRFGSLALVLALTGCPPRSTVSDPAQPQLQGAGCPAASGVFLASYVTQEPGKGRTGWVMPLHAMKVESGAQVADYAALDDAAATASGVPATPTGSLWLVSGTAAPCLVKAGGHYAAKIDGPPASLSYGVELDGCPAPSDPQEGTGVVLVSTDSPGACQFQSPKSLASRLGEMTSATAWAKPAKDTPIPAELAPLVPAHDCTAPGCEQLWAVGQVAIADKPVAWAAAVNWLAIGDPAKPCEWKAERWSGFFVPGSDGAPVKVTDGQDHPLALSAVLVDKTGAHVLLAEGPGEYSTYDLSAGKAVLGQHITWMHASPEEWDAIDHLGPICEPEGADAAKPAPLPKDAKPQSPYP
jgi:hypothetical protein